MKSRVAHCPACGAIVEFHVSSSLVTVCEYCHSAVARGDKALEDLGKVADLVQTQSPLRLGLRGQFRDRRFEIIGRVQYQHPAGGVWDEWYLLFPGERWGWLAEAQGRFYVTFDVPIRAATEVPGYDALEIGQSYNLGARVGVLKVAEKGEGVASSAEGEIPWKFEPRARVRFVDMSGEGGKFATLDYSDEAPRIYLGDEVPLEGLGLAADSGGAERPVPTVKALLLNCPKCGGPLSLHAPDESQRVTCPNCRALLDIEQGNLRYLSTLGRSRIAPLIPLGTEGTLEGTKFTVIGFLVRSVTEDGTIYRWQEYLLYAPQVGFRWLVDSDDHWSFVRPVASGDVDDHFTSARFGGRSFRLHQRSTATVQTVLGEFYWKVQVGETVEVRDLIAPPDMLSIETSPGEQNISCGSYLATAQVESAFKLDNLRRPWSIGTIQPAPAIAPIMVAWLAFSALLTFVDLGLSSRSAPKVDQLYLIYSLLWIAVVPIGVLAYRWQFEVRRWQDSEFSPYASQDDGSSGDDSDD